MANLVEASTWEAGIRQLETTDYVQGGVDGIDNIAPRQLANRTLWLKEQVEGIQGSLGNKAIRDIAEVALSSGAAVNIDGADIGTLFAYSVSAITTVNLPAAASVEMGDAFAFSVLSTNNTHINITRAGSNTIRFDNANNTVVPVYPGEVVFLVSNGVDRWHLLSAHKDASQVGSVIAHAANSAPLGYLKCNGAAVSRTTYARLFSIIGTTFGVGNGSTTFNLPDLRGEFIRGWDDARGIDSGRAFGSSQADELKSHEHELLGQLEAFSPVAGSGKFTLHGGGGSSANTTYINNTGGTETRPRNVALLYCIKF
jgi:microcystin-dependent protein